MQLSVGVTIGAECGLLRDFFRSSHGLFPQQFIDDLRLQANIVQVVQEYVPLKTGGHDLQGAVSVSFREDAVVSRESREGVLPLLRLRRRRRRVQVSRAAREGRRFLMPCGCWRRSSAWRCRSSAKPRRGRAPRRVAARSAAEAARDRGGVFPRGARRTGRDARAAAVGRPRRHGGDDRAVGSGVRALVARRAAEEAAAAGSSPQRCCCRADWSCAATPGKSSIGSETG